MGYLKLKTESESEPDPNEWYAGLQKLSCEKLRLCKRSLCKGSPFYNGGGGGRGQLWFLEHLA